MKHGTLLSSLKHQGWIIMKSLTPLFDVWLLLTALRPQPSLSPCAPHLGKLVRKPQFFLLRCWQEFQATSPHPHAGTVTPAPTLTTVKIPSQSPFLALSSHLWTNLGGLAVVLRKLPYISNKNSHTLFLRMWCHQSWHLNQIWFTLHDGHNICLSFMVSR